MLDLATISEHLRVILEGKVVFVRTDREIADFTQAADVSLVIAGKDKKVAMPLPRDELKSIAQVLRAVFSPDRTVLAWDIKRLLTHFRHHLPYVTFDLPNVYDLKPLEAFLDISRPAPTTWAEALKRTQDALKNPAALRMHRAVHLPLALRVVPCMETAGLWDRDRFRLTFTSYVVEGQTTGRLSTAVPNERFVNPHNLDDAARARYAPRPPHDLFVCFDFRNMEVVMLQWLSGDEALGKIMADPEKDVYEEIYKTVTGFEDEDRETARSKAKRFFLPVVYGEGKSTLAASLGVSPDTANALIGIIHDKFGRALKWVAGHYDQAVSEGTVTDCLGRRRCMADAQHRARHFAVASPAAAVCMEKLVALHDSLPEDYAKTVMSVHDAYYLAVRTPDYREVVAAGRQILEQPSKLCPDLWLKTSCHVGRTLGDLRKFY